jgi:hypothetical protein
MLSNTGNMSLWLSVFFILISLSGIIVIFLIIKNKSIENENIDKIIELGKWFIASVAITLSASIVNDGFRERDQDLKEMDVFDKYVDTVLQAKGIETIKLLCEYFSSVSPDGPIKTSWKDYEKKIDGHIAELKEAEKKKADLDAKEQKGAALSESEKIEIANLEEKISAAKNYSLLLGADQVQEWVIIAGSDPDAKLANDEVKKVKELNYAAVIYKKGNRYRTVVGPFLDYNEALAALSDIRKKVRSDSYSVNLKAWCKAPDEKDGYIECK